MGQKPVAKVKALPSSKVVVFGIDNIKWLTRAACFPKDQAEPARRAAKHLGLNVVEVTNGVAAALSSKLPTGLIHAAGPAAVPAVREDLYEATVAALNLKTEATRTPADPAMLKPWDAIKPGYTVLASESLRDGWNAAIVIERAGDKLTLQWRDYGGLPKFTVPLAAVALLNPLRP
jgi:hypothetical protein